MVKANKDLIVTILVPTLGPGGASSGPWDGTVGTGCAVADGLILTARHVVELGARRNKQDPIKVRGMRCALRMSALACGRPLLVRGEPGIGKSQFV